MRTQGTIGTIGRIPTIMRYCALSHYVNASVRIMSHEANKMVYVGIKHALVVWAEEINISISVVIKF